MALHPLLWIGLEEVNNFFCCLGKTFPKSRDLEKIFNGHQIYMILSFPNPGTLEKLTTEVQEYK
jgi:hypothetical protein